MRCGSTARANKFTPGLTDAHFHLQGDESGTIGS